MRSLCNSCERLNQPPPPARRLHALASRWRRSRRPRRADHLGVGRAGVNKPCGLRTARVVAAVATRARRRSLRRRPRSAWSLGRPWWVEVVQRQVSACSQPAPSPTAASPSASTCSPCRVSEGEGQKTRLCHRLDSAASSATALDRRGAATTRLFVQLAGAEADYAWGGWATTERMVAAAAVSAKRAEGQGQGLSWRTKI